MLLGDLKGAEEAFSRSLSAAITQGDSWGEMAALSGLGDVFQGTGNLDAAARAYTASLRLAEQRLGTDPANTQWQRDLSISHNKIGDGPVAQGDGPGALAAYRKSLVNRPPVNARGESFSGEPDGGNLHVRFGEGEVGRSQTQVTYLSTLPARQLRVNKRFSGYSSRSSCRR